MGWVIKQTDTFLESFEKVRNNKKVIAELSKKSPGSRKILCMLAAGCPVRFTARNPQESQNNTG
jgi:hypothetical protein